MPFVQIHLERTFVLVKKDFLETVVIIVPKLVLTIAFTGLAAWSLIINAFAT